jgi:nitrogen fixation protein NifM
MLPEKSQNRVDPALSFHLMKFAFQDFQKSSHELSDEEYIHTYQLANEEMLLHQLILSSKEACCVVIPPPVFQLTLSSVIAEYPDEGAFHDFLQLNDLNYDDYITALHNDLRVEAVLTLVAATIQDVSPLESIHYYQTHQDEFVQQEQRAASHIMISFDESSKKTALIQIMAIQKRLQHAPQQFSHEANTYSHCSSGQNGGDIGTINKGELCEELDRALFHLQKGEISPLIMNSNGFHLLHCRSIIPEKNIPFDQASPDIFARLLKEKQMLACRSWLKTLVRPR